jgi:mono/diheme cytochrome c family protein
VEELMRRSAILLCLVGMVTCLAISAIAQKHARSAVSASSVASAANSDHASATHSAATSSTPVHEEKAIIESALRIEGEKRFHTNCGRCHMAPHKFPPRVMATAIRHMRVRAMLTDEDMRLILHYMTQ